MSCRVAGQRLSRLHFSRRSPPPVSEASADQHQHKPRCRSSRGRSSRACRTGETYQAQGRRRGVTPHQGGGGDDVQARQGRHPVRQNSNTHDGRRLWSLYIRVGRVGVRTRSNRGSTLSFTPSMRTIDQLRPSHCPPPSALAGRRATVGPPPRSRRRLRRPRRRRARRRRHRLLRGGGAVRRAGSPRRKRKKLNHRPRNSPHGASCAHHLSTFLPRTYRPSSIPTAPPWVLAPCRPY